MYKYKYIAYIGRFQFSHLGHAEMLKNALSLGKCVIVVVGSAFSARTPKNPMKFDEVVSMLKCYLTASEISRVQFVPQPDLGNDRAWVKAVTKKIKRITGKSKCALLSHIKDDSGYYQELFPSFPLEKQPLYQDGLSASHLRDIVFSTTLSTPEKEAQLKKYVGSKPLEYLLGWMRKPWMAALIEESLYYKDYSKKFAFLDWPPVFSTSDFVAACEHQGKLKVLVIVRGHCPGKGCLAFPGGFLNPNETFLGAAIRECQEETGLSETEVKQCFVKAELFDNPARSLRGRVVTVAHYFWLGCVERLPEVNAADDAAEAKWVTLDYCVEHRDEFFEDHYWSIFRKFFR